MAKAVDDVAALRARVQALEAELASLRGAARADRDGAILAGLVPAIAEATDDRNFTAAELLSTYRRRSARLDRSLREAGISGGRQLGQLFACAAGRPVSGLVLQQRSECGRKRAGMVWAVCIATE